MEIQNYFGWQENLRKMALSHKKEDNIAYCEAMEHLNGTTDKTVVEILIRSFTWGVETGMQQSVYNVLSTIDFSLYYECLLKLLPQLVIYNKQLAFELLDYPCREMSKSDIEQFALLICPSNEIVNLVIKVIQENEEGNKFPWNEIRSEIKRQINIH
ncbi:MAG: hypothetical protein NTX45_22670 [Proteobacteria bacterium]|nr:hypothetical protein [Pseudomonadota bacterium]